MKGTLVTAKICVLCDRGFSNQFDIVLETPYSFDAVGREALVSYTSLGAVLCGLEHLRRKSSIDTDSKK